MLEKEPKRIGDMLNQFYNLELRINDLITIFFKPEKKKEFFNIMLNTAVTSYGAKVKILPNLLEIDKRIISDLHELGRIRNGVAHVAPHLVLILKEGKGKMNSLTTKLEIMQSNGKIVKKDFWELSDRFNELLDIVVPVISGHTKALE